MFNRFKKKRQREYRPIKPSKDVEVECPNCGTKHTFHFEDCNTLFLDGTSTMSASKLLNLLAICPQCSLLFMIHNPDLHNPAAALQDTEYQKAIHQQYASDEERKIALFDALYQASSAPLLYAHYYREISNEELEQKWLHQAIQNILDEKRYAIYSIPAHAFAAFDTRAAFSLYPEHRLVDLYRRTHQMQKALEQINHLHSQEYHFPPTMLFKYLDCEEQLIQKNITNAV